MVETLKTLIGIENTQYDFIIITFCMVLIVFCFKYSADLLAYILKLSGGRK